MVVSLSGFLKAGRAPWTLQTGTCVSFLASLLLPRSSLLVFEILFDGGTWTDNGLIGWETLGATGPRELFKKFSPALYSSLERVD